MKNVNAVSWIQKGMGGDYPNGFIIQLKEGVTPNGKVPGLWERIDEEFIDIPTVRSADKLEDVKKCKSCGCLNRVEFDECYSCGKLFDKPEEEFIGIGVPEGVPEIKKGCDNFVTPNIVKAPSMTHSIKLIPINEKPDEPDEPEIIGNYMHYRGEDYYFYHTKEDNVDVTCSNCSCYDKDGCRLYGQPISCEYGYWKNIKEIDITDELAKLRPWVITKQNLDYKKVYKIYGVNDKNQIIIEENRFFPLKASEIQIATTSDLKKAGITE